MPVGISSPARNLFLLGSSGDALVTNFFKSIDKSSSFDEVYVPKKVRYRYSDDSYILAGYAQDGNSRRLSWVENRTYNPDNASSTEVWHHELESLDFVSNASDSSTSLYNLCIDGNGNLFAVGESNNTNWIAKYNSFGGLQWASTTYRGLADYKGVASDGECCYVTGEFARVSFSEAQSVVEKYDYDGTPLWGTVVKFDGEEVSLKDIGVTSDGNVIAVGNINFDYGYMVKLDSGTGQILWDKTFKSPIYRGGFSTEPQNVRPEKLFVDGKGQIYIIGRILYGADYNSFLIKCDPEGNIIWQRTAEGSANESVEFLDISAETETEQVIVYGNFEPVSGRQSAMLSKYTKDGSLLWRRTIETDANPSGSGLTGTGFNLDADSSFYYMTFCDQLPNGLTGVPDRYTFGKVSTSGNGLGDFQYTDGMSHTIDYKIKDDLQHKIGVLQDNSVSTNVSNLISNPFSANTILFDDYATNISGKKRILGHTHGEEVANKWFYESGTALRPVDFPHFEIAGANLPFNGTSGSGAVYETPSNLAPYWDFDGTDVGITIPHTDELAFTTPVMSFEAWVYMEGGLGTGGEFSIINKRGDTGSGTNNYRPYNLSIHSDGYVRWILRSSNNVLIVCDTTAGGIQANQWYHIVATNSAFNAKVFINGVQANSVNSSTLSNLVNSFDTPTRIGWRHTNSGQQYTDGRLGELRLYDYVLSDEQIFQNYNANVGKYNTGNIIDSIAPKITTNVPYSFNQVGGTSLKLYVDFGNRYSYSFAENRLATSFKNGSNWFKQQVTVEANAAIAPDGTKTATLVTENDVTGFHFISSAATLSGARTFSAYLKAGNQPRATMFITQTGNNGARFNLETGQVLSVFGTGNSAAIEDVGGGWYRCSVANDGVAAEPDDQLRISPMNGATNSETPGSPLRSIYVWGPQVEKKLLNPPTAGRYVETYDESFGKNNRNTLNNLVLAGEQPILNGSIHTKTINNIGTYLAFDGVDDHISFNTALTIGGNAGWAVELWIRVMDPQNDNTAGTWNYFFRDAVGGSPTYECGMYSNGSPAFALKDNDASNTNVQMDMTPGAWHYICFGVTGNITQKTFMYSSDENGTFSTQQSTGTVSGLTCVIQRLMSNQTGGQCLTAHVGEIRIFTNSLGSQLAERNFNATRSKYGI